MHFYSKCKGKERLQTDPIRAAHISHDDKHVWIGFLQIELNQK